MNTEILETMIAQIGRTTHLGVSGGRVIVISENRLHLPVSNGYRVEIEYDYAWDYYTVRRILRKGKSFQVKGEQTQVSFDELSEVVWQAHAYQNREFGTEFAV